MIRTGVYKLNQIKQNKLIDLFGKDKNISIRLYKDILLETESGFYERYSEIILNRFNTNSNAIKRTYRNRFDEFDDLIIETMHEQNYLELDIHDIAISDGRASCYFLTNVLRNFKDVKYQGSDIAVFYYLYTSKESPGTYIITDENERIIEITRPPFVWNYARNEGLFYFLNNALKSIYRRKYDGLIKSNALDKPEKILLTDREYNKLISRYPNFKVANYNLLEKTTSKFNIIRIMNILHWGYFNEAQLTKILLNIFNSLHPGGLFIEGSNEDAGSNVAGAIYKKGDSGFELIASASTKSRILKNTLAFNAVAHDYTQ